MQSKFYIPASGDFVFISVHGPVCGDAHKNFHSPQNIASRERRFGNAYKNLRSRIDSSACGNAIKILHPRKRRFCIYFGSWSQNIAFPRAEMHINAYFHSPLAGIRSGIDNSACGDAIKKYCIPANGASVTFSREMHIEIYIPPLAGIRTRIDSSAWRECNQNFTSPQAEILYLISVYRPRERRCT